MKKMLLAFIVFDLFFVALILTISSHKTRYIASDSLSELQVDPNLSEGQKNKWILVQSLKFEADETSLQLTTDKLQMICETSTSIELVYHARNMAVAGEAPAISHTFSCQEIKKDLAISTLSTRLDDFKDIHTQKRLAFVGNEITSKGVYSDEPFPKEWRLAEIKIIGPNTFTINEYEIEKTLLKDFDFEITSAK